MTGSLLLLCVSISAKLLCCPSGECRYIPGEGEEEAEDGYFGKTTQNTAYPAQRTAGGGPLSSNSHHSRPFTGPDSGSLMIMHKRCVCFI
jgi:hypothetical protein